MKQREEKTEFDANMIIFIMTIAPFIYLITPLPPPFQINALLALVGIEAIGPLLIIKLSHPDKPVGLTIHSGLHSNPRIIAERKQQADIKILEEDIRIHSLSNNYKFLGVFLMTDRYAAIYRPRWKNYDVVSFNGDNLRWISTVNMENCEEPTLVLDVEIDLRWYTIEIYSGIGDRIYTILRQIFDSQVLANRYRRLPNERIGPITARDAFGPVAIYKTPLWLVVIREGMVIHQVQLDQVDDIDTVLNILGIEKISPAKSELLKESHMSLARLNIHDSRDEQPFIPENTL